MLSDCEAKIKLSKGSLQPAANALLTLNSVLIFNIVPTKVGTHLHLCQHRLVANPRTTSIFAFEDESKDVAPGTFYSTPCGLHPYRCIKELDPSLAHRIYRRSRLFFLQRQPGTTPFSRVSVSYAEYIKPPKKEVGLLRNTYRSGCSPGFLYTFFLFLLFFFLVSNRPIVFQYN